MLLRTVIDVPGVTQSSSTHMNPKTGNSLLSENHDFDGKDLTGKACFKAETMFAVQEGPFEQDDDKISLNCMPLSVAQEQDDMPLAKEQDDMSLAKEQEDMSLAKEQDDMSLPKEQKDMSLSIAKEKLRQQEKDKVFMQMAIVEAGKSIPVPTAFCVGAVLVNQDKVLSTGFSRELEGNTHAEQVCLMKLKDPELAHGATIYSTMEPCGLRLSGNTPCAHLLIQAKISRVVVGVMEPTTFVGPSQGKRLLLEHGIQVDVLPGFESECLAPNASVLS